MSKRKAFAAPSLFAMPAQSEQAHTPAIPPAVKQACRFEYVKENAKGCLIAVRCTHDPVDRGYCVQHKYVLRVLDAAKRAGYCGVTVGAHEFPDGEKTWQEAIVRMSQKKVDSVVAALEDIA